jgi:hypothetical protein
VEKSGEGPAGEEEKEDGEEKLLLETWIKKKDKGKNTGRLCLSNRKKTVNRKKDESDELSAGEEDLETGMKKGKGRNSLRRKKTGKGKKLDNSSGESSAGEGDDSDEDWEDEQTHGKKKLTPWKSTTTTKVPVRSSGRARVKKEQSLDNLSTSSPLSSVEPKLPPLTRRTPAKSELKKEKEAVIQQQEDDTVQQEEDLHFVPEIIVKDEVLLDSDDAGDFISMDFPADDDEEEESFCVIPARLVCPGGSCPCEGGKWSDIVHGTLEPRLKLHPCDDMAKHYKTLQERNRKKASIVPVVSKVLRGGKAPPAVPVVPKVLRGGKAPPSLPVVSKIRPSVKAQAVPVVPKIRTSVKAQAVPVVPKIPRGAKATPAVPVVPKITRGAKAPAPAVPVVPKIPRGAKAPPAVPVVPKVPPAPRVEVEKKAPMKVYPGRRKAPPPAPSKKPSVLLPVLPVALTRPLRNSPSRSLGSAPQPHYWSQIVPSPDDEEDAPADDDGDEDYVPDKDPLAF